MNILFVITLSLVPDAKNVCFLFD